MIYMYNSNRIIFIFFDNKATPFLLKYHEKVIKVTKIWIINISIDKLHFQDEVRSIVNS